MLALIAAFAGVPLTILQARGAIQNWAQSGKRFPLGVWDIVDLKEKDTLVYYESLDSVPTEYINLTVMDLNDNLVSVSTPRDKNDFSYKQVQGAALFKISIPAPGSYRFVCNDVMAASIAESSSNADRIVFAKSPNSKAEALKKSTMTYIIGGGSTLLLAAVLYIMHGIWLQRKKRPSKAKAPASFMADVGVPDE